MLYACNLTPIICPVSTFKVNNFWCFYAVGMITYNTCFWGVRTGVEEIGVLLVPCPAAQDPLPEWSLWGLLNVLIFFFALGVLGSERFLVVFLKHVLHTKPGWSKP